MKTYEQVLNRAVLNGFHDYFGGGSYYRGAHDFVDAVTFIYAVPRDKFMEDIVRREDAAREHIKEYAEQHGDSPARKYNEKYREKTHNRIRYNQGNE